MQGLTEYIRWLGRFSFDELPMGDADAMVMCVMSYFDLAPALRDGTGLVSGCGPCLENGSATLQITGGDMGNSDIFRAAIASKRFGTLRITDYEDILEPETPMQFSAVTFRWDGGAFIAFRGTDETVAGWKEDFMIAFTETKAQRAALDYAARVIARGGRCSMGGHSKGGNLALYAAGRLPEEAWAQVDRVFLLDGPGLCPEVMDVSVVDRVNEKATRFLPEFSVVGRLFEPSITDTRIIRSSASGLLEHSLATWQVEYGPPALAEEHDRRSIALMEILNRWIADMSQEDRRIFTEDLFGALAAGGAVTLRDAEGSGPRSFEASLLRMFHASDATKKIMRDLPAQAIAVLRRQLTHGEEA